MRRLIMIALVALIAAQPVLAADEPANEEQKTLYAVGLIMARQLSVFNLTPAEFELVKRGLTDAMTGKAVLVDIDAYKKKTQELAIARRDAGGGKPVAGTREFLDRAAREKGAIKTASGLVYLSLKEGGGASPAASDKVTVHYRGTLSDGREFDSSYKRGQAASFPLNSVMPCWTEGVQMMKAGGKARLVCPPETAYGAQGSGPVPADAPLIFEIELLEVTR